MERKDFDRERGKASGEDHDGQKSAKESDRGGSSSLESMMADLGYTDEGAAKDFERQGDVTDFTRKSQDADFAHEPPGNQFTVQGGGGGQRGGSTGPKPYTGSQAGVSTGSSGRMSTSGIPADFGSGRYVGLGKIAKHVGMDVKQLRSCAQSQGILPDKHLRSCDMFSQDKAHEIMQACGTGLSM